MSARGGCSICGVPFVAADRTGWTCRITRQALSFAPGGDEARLVRIAEGRSYLFCPGCSALLDTGRFGDLAKRLTQWQLAGRFGDRARRSARARRVLRVARAASTAGSTLLLMALAARLGPPLPDEEVARRWGRPRVGVS